MTNIFKSKAKVDLKRQLFRIGLKVLSDLGWTVSRVPGMGKSSLREITKGDERHRVSIRTSQDQWFAFPPEPDGKGWITLDDVGIVLAVSVDDTDSPKEALVHWLDAKDLRARFDSAAKARLQAGQKPPTKRRGLWLPLYHAYDGKTVRYVGGGAGLVHKPIARVPLNGGASAPPNTPHDTSSNGDSRDDDPIASAKRGLARYFKVPESAIRITIEA